MRDSLTSRTADQFIIHWKVQACLAQSLYLHRPLLFNHIKARPLGRVVWYYFVDTGCLDQCFDDVLRASIIQKFKRRILPFRTSNITSFHLQYNSPNNASILSATFPLPVKILSITVGCRRNFGNRNTSCVISTILMTVHAKSLNFWLIQNGQRVNATL